MIEINAVKHPGLHRYARELRQYPELTKEQYHAVIDDLKQPEKNDVYQTAREKLICSHLGMVLTMAVKTIHRYYGLSMEDFVGIGNQALVECFEHFNPDTGGHFASYMKKVTHHLGTRRGCRPGFHRDCPRQCRRLSETTDGTGAYDPVKR